MQVYDHQFEDYDSLVSILLKKGMAGDPAVIARRLEDVGYQRLSSYWKPFEYDVIRLDRKFGISTASIERYGVVCWMQSSA